MLGIIDNTHLHLALAKGIRTMCNYIGKMWLVITEKVFEVYRNLYPSLSFGPLKMMILDTFGSRAQMDLVDMHRKEVNMVIHRPSKQIFTHSLSQNKKATTVERELI